MFDDCTDNQDCIINIAEIGQNNYNYIYRNKRNTHEPFNAWEIWIYFLILFDCVDKLTNYHYMYAKVSKLMLSPQHS